MITLLIVTILVSLAVEFAYDVYINTSALSNWTNAQKASLMAKSGQTLGSNFLKKIDPNNTQTEIYVPVEKDLGQDTTLIIKIEDENSKININSIIQPIGTDNAATLASLQKLFEYLNIDPNLALAIADYIDPNQEPRHGLRDSEDGAKNSELWSIDELRLVKGIDKKTFETIRPYIAAYGKEKSVININTAKLPVLFSLCDEMTETLAQQIIDYRESTPFNKTNELFRVSGMQDISQYCTDQMTKNNINVQSSFFRIISTATVNEITRVIESIIDTFLNIQYWREG